MRRRHAAAVAAVGAIALVGPGCGDELAEFREDELRPLEEQAQAQKARLAATLKVADARDAHDARMLESQLASLEQTFAELAQLDPPSDYDADYARFVAANEAFSAHMHRFIAGLRRADRRAMNSESERAKQAVGAAQRALEPLRG